VAIIILDAEQGFESQDMNLIALAHKYRKGILVMVNKWDLIEKDTNTADAFKKSIEEKLGPLSYAPVIFTSVLKKQRIYKAIETAIDIYENRYRKVPTSELNDKMLVEIEKYQPPSYRGKYIKIKYITQLPTKTPTFAFFCNHPKYIKEPYKRYLENKMRSHFNFVGVPIKIVFRNK
jgi:GTP-binding protein